MKIRWVLYQSLGRNLQSDFEKIMIYTDPSQGIYMEDMYRYISDICFIYACIFSRTALNSSKKENVDLIYEEIYRRNENFLSNLQDVFSGKKYITIKEAEQFLAKFQVPKTQ